MVTGSYVCTLGAAARGWYLVRANTFCYSQSSSYGMALRQAGQQIAEHAGGHYVSPCGSMTCAVHSGPRSWLEQAVENLV